MKDDEYEERKSLEQRMHPTNQTGGKLKKYIYIEKGLFALAGRLVMMSGL